MVCQIDIFLAVLYYRAGQFFLIDVNDCDFSSIVQQTTVLQAGIYHVFQERKQNGNIVFQDMVIPDKQEIYKIDLDGFKADQYELFYIEKDVTFIGEFEIE